MYRLKVRAEFSSAHNLRGYKGKCEELHGHNWKVEAVIEKSHLDKSGLALDFHEIKDILQETLQELDHKYLNELAYFKKANPTSENLAKYIYGKISLLLNKNICRLKEVTVWESDSCAATYSK